MNKSNIAGLSLTAFALAISIPTGISAQQPNCKERDVVVKRLAEKYGETRQYIGLGSNGMMMETFASKETGSWTITMTMPNGITCLLASGQNYEPLNDGLPSIEEEARFFTTAPSRPLVARPL